MNRKSILMLVVPLALAGAAARAQSDLGSPKAERTFSASYKQAVEAAFPRYEDAALQGRLNALVQKYPAGRDTLQIRKVDQLERAMSLPHVTAQPGQLRIVTPEREYEVDPAEGRVFLLQKPSAPRPMTPAQVKELKPQVSAFHDDVLKRIGIPAEEILYRSTDVIMGQGVTNPARGAPQKTPPVVHGVRTYVLRAIDGVQVEGSSASLVSQAAGRVDALDVRWPPFAFAPQLKTLAIRNRGQVQAAIASRLEGLARGAKVSLKMAVVLRQVQAGNQRYYVPAMKVGMRTEGEGEGIVFYESLTGQPLPEPRGQSDSPSGG
ncbi:MAG TPA: hypothetical protein VFT91_07055 [Dehalococcoidia bacterium]|nr:hypothetical protein [Dehalococcoidia bacterium]